MNYHYITLTINCQIITAVKKTSSSFFQPTGAIGILDEAEALTIHEPGIQIWRVQNFAKIWLKKTTSVLYDSDFWIAIDICFFDLVFEPLYMIKSEVCKFNLHVLYILGSRKIQSVLLGPSVLEVYFLGSKENASRDSGELKWNKWAIQKWG